MFKVAKTWSDPSQSGQRGFPAPGTGQQTVGQYSPPPRGPAPGNDRPTKGLLSWLFPSAEGQRGFPSPENAAQHRPKGTMDRKVKTGGRPLSVWTPPYSRGSDAVVQNFGKVLTNPIGAGIQVKHRPQAFYGNAGQYLNHQIFWTSQAIPTSVRLQGLNSAADLSSIFNDIQIQGVVRVT